MAFPEWSSVLKLMTSVVFTFFLWEPKNGARKANQHKAHKHFSDSPCETNPTRPREKRDGMAILLWNSTGNGGFVPGTGSEPSP